MQSISTAKQHQTTISNSHHPKKILCCKIHLGTIEHTQMLLPKGIANTSETLFVKNHIKEKGKKKKLVFDVLNKNIASL